MLQLNTIVCFLRPNIWTDIIFTSNVKGFLPLVILFCSLYSLRQKMNRTYSSLLNNPALINSIEYIGIDGRILLLDLYSSSENSTDTSNAMQQIKASKRKAIPNQIFCSITEGTVQQSSQESSKTHVSDLTWFCSHYLKLLFQIKINQKSWSCQGKFKPFFFLVVNNIWKRKIIWLTHLSVQSFLLIWILCNSLNTF